ncbi:SpoIIAA family protein [Oryzicola mucosus]|uniref:STAS/SEC14 domain-containing protein n=1 Tax=Oryzicola mucosus TaxID=2767425 RepID=A0A8J6TZT6_9HYPH|nr:STAS/SEC14 domain-containing protein [Oryzicola mucosus]MBD0414776.1 STAS/SEC14 domain-containing protein [Oryzicola mucosus]
MNPIDPIPAIRRIETDRGDVCALEIVGHVSDGDIENAYGLIDAVAMMHETIDILVRVTDYEGIDWSAIFMEDGEAQKPARKFAFVGGPGLIRTAMTTFGPFKAEERRNFDYDHEAEAWEWIGATPLPAE